MKRKQKQQPTIRNTDVAKVFEEIADLLEIQGDNPFRIRAYRNASNLVGGLGVSVTEMLANGEDLTELPGIGKDLAAKIREIADTSTCTALEKLRKELPPTLPALLKIPGLGPKRVQTLYHRLDIGTPEQLYQAVHEGKVRELPGFGEKIEKVILHAIEKPVGTGARFKLAVAAPHAERLKAYLAKIPGVNQVVIAGSYRRSRETVGDIDIVVTAKRGRPVMERFCKYKEVIQVVSKGTTRATVKLSSGLQVDVRVVPQASFGAALHYFTGSKGHNLMIRRLGQQKRLKINEYGVFRSTKGMGRPRRPAASRAVQGRTHVAGSRMLRATDTRASLRIAGQTEESVFRAVGSSYIPPELRENRGEIEAAAASRLPKLVELDDIKGDLHVHTQEGGGQTLQDMAQAARRRGLQYLAVIAHGPDPRRLRKALDEIDRLNQTLRGMTLLRGAEVDIRADGDLDVPALGELDLVIATVHGNFELPRARQTECILRAMDDPRLTILAQPTGPGRAYDVDMPRIIRKARERGCFLELSAHPDRLDLLDVHCRTAKDEGVLIAISADARRAEDFANLIYGVGQARRGWLEAKDVLNTRPLEELRALIGRRGQ